MTICVYFRLYGGWAVSRAWTGQEARPSDQLSGLQLKFDDGGPSYDALRPPFLRVREENFCCSCCRAARLWVTCELEDGSKRKGHCVLSYLFRYLIFSLSVGRPIPFLDRNILYGNSHSSLFTCAPFTCPPTDFVVPIKTGTCARPAVPLFLNVSMFNL